MAILSIIPPSQFIEAEIHYHSWELHERGGLTSQHVAANVLAVRLGQRFPEGLEGGALFRFSGCLLLFPLLLILLLLLNSAVPLLSLILLGRLVKIARDADERLGIRPLLLHLFDDDGQER